MVCGLWKVVNVDWNFFIGINKVRKILNVYSNLKLIIWLFKFVIIFLEKVIESYGNLWVWMVSNVRKIRF